MMVNSKKHTQDNEMGYYKLTNFKVVCIKELPKSLPSYIGLVIVNSDKV